MTLEQYYTEAKIGERLVSLLPDFSPARCVELSAGEGALLIPVVNKWTDIEVTTCEIDSINHAKLERDFSGDHYNLDVISSTFESMVSRYEHAFDLAVSNPPFSWRENNNYEKEVLSRFNLDFMLNWKRVRSEVVFILQNLRLVKPSGFLAIILPELIVCSRLFSTFRKELLNYCSIHAIFEIERGAFKRTEAKTYIVVLRNQKVEGVYNFHDADGMVCERPQSKFAEIELNKSIREQEFSESPLF